MLSFAYKRLFSISIGTVILQYKNLYSLYFTFNVFLFQVYRIQNVPNFVHGLFVTFQFFHGIVLHSISLQDETENRICEQYYTSKQIIMNCSIKDYISCQFRLHYNNTKSVALGASQYGNCHWNTLLHRNDEL